MVTKLPRDFKDFLRLLSSHQVEYLVIGGYAVAHHAYPRPMADFDVWIALNPVYASRAVSAIAAFGFEQPDLTTDLLMTPGRIVRMGMPPMRLEVMNMIDGVEFADCYARCIVSDVEGIAVNMISLDDLKKNKAASGRNKDKNDLDHLP
jgi:predicted nucleotidyltransferase